MKSDPKFKEAKETDAEPRQRCQAFTQLLVNDQRSSSQSAELVLLAKPAKSLYFYECWFSFSFSLFSWIPTCHIQPHLAQVTQSLKPDIANKSWKWWWPRILFWWGGLVVSLICFPTQLCCVLLTAPVNLKLFKNRSCALSVFCCSPWCSMLHTQWVPQSCC